MNGKNNNRHRNRSHFSRHRDDERRNEQSNEAAPNREKNITGRNDKSASSTDSASAPICRWCNKPIKDIVNAITDKETGQPIHFDCVLERITSMEKLELNESICYIGGGRFGIVKRPNSYDVKNFSIRKIFEWEEKGINIDWRKPVNE